MTFRIFSNSTSRSIKNLLKNGSERVTKPKVFIEGKCHFCSKTLCEEEGVKIEQEAGHVITVTSSANTSGTSDPVANKRRGHDFSGIITRLTAYLRWSDLINLLLHTGQMKFFSPVWVLMWRASSSLRANFLRQPAQLHGNGLSPETRKINI